jgi:hypothetical protein
MFHLRVTALVLLLAATASLTGAEYREFNGLIEADSTFIHYSEGYIVAPGFIDLTHLTFTTVDDDDDADAPYEDGEEREPGEEKDGEDDEDDDAKTDQPGDEHGGDRRQLSDIAAGNTVDIVFFNEVRDIVIVL